MLKGTGRDVTSNITNPRTTDAKGVLGKWTTESREAHMLSLNPMPCCHCHRINTRTDAPLVWPRRTFLELSCSMNKKQIDFSITLRKVGKIYLFKIVKHCSLKVRSPTQN